VHTYNQSDPVFFDVDHSSTSKKLLQKARTHYYPFLIHPRRFHRHYVHVIPSRWIKMLENKTTSFGLHSTSMTVLMSGNNVFRRGGHQRCPTIHNPAQTKSIDTFVKWCVVKINVLVTWARQG
jgi:hypothetical protein